MPTRFCVRFEGRTHIAQSLSLILYCRFLPKTNPPNSAHRPVVYPIHHVQREVSRKCARGRRTTATLEAYGTERGFCRMVCKPSSYPKSHGVLVSRPPLVVMWFDLIIFFSADAYDSVMPIIPHLTHATPFSTPIFTLAIVSFVVILPILPVLPLRPIFLVGGLLPFALTHPWSLHVLPKVIPPLLAYAWETVQHFIDDDRLSDEAWMTPLKEVELWENERWSNTANSSAVVAGWSKANLRPGERTGWTRRRDGSSDASSTTGGKGDGGVRSDSFLLPLESCVKLIFLWQ